MIFYLAKQGSGIVVSEVAQDNNLRNSLNH